MRVLHLLTSGHVGGIEVLCRDIGLNSLQEHTFAFLFGEGMVFEDMKRRGLNAVSLAYGSKLTKQRYEKLLELASKQDAVIVHHNDPFLEMYYLAIMARYPHKKYISMIHHCYNFQEEVQQYGIVKRTIKSALVSAMFRKSDKLIFVSKAGLASYQEKYPIKMDKTVVVYNGIGVDKLSHSAQTVKNTDQTVKLLYAGRLEKIKGVSQLVDAIKLMENEDIILYVVGDGSERQHLEEQVKRLNLEKKVRFEGFRQDVRPWMQDAAIFVYPSEMEIFGIAIVEAMAYRCICVANAVGGIPEIIQDGRNGFLNHENSAAGLKNSIQKALHILKDPTGCSRMMQNARETAERFGIMDTIRALENEVSCIAK